MATRTTGQVQDVADSALKRRCQIWPPEDTSVGAVPLQREGVCVRKPRDVADFGEDPPGDHRADAIQASQRRARRSGTETCRPSGRHPECSLAAAER